MPQKKLSRLLHNSQNEVRSRKAGLLIGLPLTDGRLNCDAQICVESAAIGKYEVNCTSNRSYPWYVGIAILMTVSRPKQVQPDREKKWTMTPEQARDEVWGHWEDLRKQCGRRFPRDGALAEEGLTYLLEKLPENDWSKARSWEGRSTFRTFITTVARRLLADFNRSKFGHVREPEWLKRKNDPIWHDAHRILIVEKWSRTEGVAQLELSYPEREQWFVHEVMAQVRANSRELPQRPEVPLPEEALERTRSDNSPDNDLQVKNIELIEALTCCLQGEDEPQNTVDARVCEILRRLKDILEFTETDRLMLRMYYVDGLKIPAIKKRLKLTGDPYKRLRKLVGKIRKACKAVGVEGFDDER